MSPIQELKNRLRAHEETPYPEGYRGKVLSDIDLTVMDCNSIACLHSIIATEGLLSSRGKRELTKAQQDLAKVTPQLEGEALAYFTRLQTLLQDATQFVRTE